MKQCASPFEHAVQYAAFKSLRRPVETCLSTGPTSPATQLARSSDAERVRAATSEITDRRSCISLAPSVAFWDQRQAQAESCRVFNADGVSGIAAVLLTYNDYTAVLSRRGLPDGHRNRGRRRDRYPGTRRDAFAILVRQFLACDGRCDPSARLNPPLGR